MFKINRLSIISDKEEKFDYNFKNGINYFKGANNSGKTEFYNFIDYMFGSSQQINKKEWYKDSLGSAILEFEYNNIVYELKRTLNKEINFFRYKDEEWGESINSSEYKDKLNSIFAKNATLLKDIRDFTEESLTYRTFTVFNYLGERSLGTLNDFFTKGKEIKFATKLPVILNYIFNNNLKKISDLKKRLSYLQSEVNKLEKAINRFDFIKNNINLNLKKLNISISYSGKNKDAVLSEINAIKEFENAKKSRKKSKTISELESILNNLDEQIKVYENTIEDSKNFENENNNRKKLLQTLSELISEKSDYEYLVEPLINMTSDLDKSISFNKYIITNNTIKELRKQREDIKNEIIGNEARFTIFDVSEKSRAITLVEEYLSIDISYNTKELDKKRKLIRELKAEIKVLQNTDNDEKIKNLSDFITTLYESAKQESDIIKKDTEINGFYIQYYKKGNLLQPQINNNAKDERENYYTGSMARHTLIQLCGYLGFLNILIQEGKYPLIPILVIDHISKPFDSNNRRAIGIILQKFYETVSVNNFQMFIFDDEVYEDLAITPNYSEDLVTENKSGFNPFYHLEKSK